MKLIHVKTLIITITIPKVRIEAADPTMVKAEIDNFKGSYNEIEAKDLSIVNVSFKIIAIKEVHHNKIVLNMAMAVNPISRGTMLILMSWPENQGILFFYISKTLEMIRISFMASLLNAVL